MKQQRLTWLLIVLTCSFIACSAPQPEVTAETVQFGGAAKPTKVPKPPTKKTPLPTPITPTLTTTTIAKTVPTKTPVLTPTTNSASVTFIDVVFNGFPIPGKGVDGGIQIAGAAVGTNGKPIKDGESIVINQPFAILVAARIPESAQKNGDGVATVDFSIDKPNGKQYTRTEKSVNYCSFSDVGPVCNLQKLDDNWPDGSYTVNVTIHPADPDATTVNWNFTFVIKRK